MKSRVFDLIDIDSFSMTPKYLQLANSIVNAIEVGKIKRNDVLPSINELTAEFDISKVTAEKGYKHLRSIGVLESIPGKGYFIKDVDLKKSFKVCLLFNKLSTHKKLIYDAIQKVLGEQAHIDLYIYNNDFYHFKKLLLSRADDYTHYVIIPHFIDEDVYAHAVINSIPKDKLIMLDKKIDGVKGEYAGVYENFERDIYGALEEALEQLKKYQKLKIIFPLNTYYPREIIKGFLRFCRDNSFDHKIVHDIKDEPIEKGDVYINLMEDDLVTLIKKVFATDLKVGKDLGIISYNETPLKKVLLNGVTTISTDFEQMGVLTARLILAASKQEITVPFKLTLRETL
jgi:DNA-binding transcriptional regulator YhcF (GntR family)